MERRRVLILFSSAVVVFLFALRRLAVKSTFILNEFIGTVLFRKFFVTFITPLKRLIGRVN